MMLTALDCAENTHRLTNLDAKNYLPSLSCSMVITHYLSTTHIQALAGSLWTDYTEKPTVLMSRNTKHVQKAWAGCSQWPQLYCNLTRHGFEEESEPDLFWTALNGCELVISHTIKLNSVFAGMSTLYPHFWCCLMNSYCCFVKRLRSTTSVCVKHKQVYFPQHQTF